MLLGPVAGADTEEWRRMVSVNLLGLLYCTHAALPLIEQSGGGDIVNVSSVAGRRADAGGAVYNMTKFGVHAFSEALRQEALHAGIRVTTVAPGFVETELQGHNRDPLVQQALSRSREQIGEVLSPSDIADAIVHAVTRPRARVHQRDRGAADDAGALSRAKLARPTRTAVRRRARSPRSSSTTRILRMRLFVVRDQLLCRAGPPAPGSAVGAVVADAAYLARPVLRIRVVELELLGELVVEAQLGARGGVDHELDAQAAAAPVADRQVVGVVAGGAEPQAGACGHARDLGPGAAARRRSAAACRTLLRPSDRSA